MNIEQIRSLPYTRACCSDYVLGYDRTAGYKTAGYIYRNEDGPEGEFELHQDHLTGIHPVKWNDIGLCDARCFYGR